MPDCLKTLRPYFKGYMIDNEGYNPETGLAKLHTGLCQAISFGMLAINNPDLPNRILNNWKLNTSFDFGTFFSGGEKGYTDFPDYTDDTVDWLQPLKLGAIDCINRIFMAPMTRMRCNPADGIANDLVSNYY
jgi:2,4-dienoyl-CoA reductase-like NADH-dependent reductase (Old Yellow Enzyme family)